MLNTYKPPPYTVLSFARSFLGQIPIYFCFRVAFLQVLSASVFISCPLALSRFPLKTVFDLHFYHMVPTCDRRGVGVGVIVLFRILSVEEHMWNGWAEDGKPQTARRDRQCDVSKTYD